MCSPHSGYGVHGADLLFFFAHLSLSGIFALNTQRQFYCGVLIGAAFLILLELVDTKQHLTLTSHLLTPCQWNVREQEERKQECLWVEIKAVE